MKHKHLLATLLGVLLTTYALAQPAVDYYDAANNKSGEALRTALHNIIEKNCTTISYSDLKTVCYAATNNPSDFNNGPNNYLEDIYSSYSYVVGDGGSSATNCGTGWNKEHTVPKSWFNDASPMESDAHHIFPTDIKMNSDRASLPYGETNASLNCSQYGYGAKGTSNRTGYSGTVFEPRETSTANYKGDIARVYFYMLTRYMNIDLAQTNDAKVMFNYENNTVNFTDYGMNLMLEWHREDPVSQKEITRNNAIETHQGNRNPFVDYPCLAEYIWGNKVGEAFNTANCCGSFESGFAGDGCTACGNTTPPTDPSISVNPASITITTAPGSSKTATITITGSNLTADIALAVTGTGFSIDQTTLAPTNGTVAATTITVTFAPTAAGEQNGTITISSPGATNKTVSLRAVGTTAAIAPAPPTTPVVFFGTVVNDAHTFSGTTATLHLHISDLATDVTVASSNTDIFTVSTSTTKNTITPDEAAAGVTITLTKIKAGQANLTITGGVVNKTYAITFQ